MKHKSKIINDMKYNIFNIGINNQQFKIEKDSKSWTLGLNNLTLILRTETVYDISGSDKRASRDGFKSIENEINKNE